jgi:hypothetical protein
MRIREISVPPEGKSIYDFALAGLFRLFDSLLNAFQKERPSRLENLLLIALRHFQPAFVRPVSEVCKVRTVVKIVSEAATPPDKIFRM